MASLFILVCSVHAEVLVAAMMQEDRKLWDKEVSGQGFLSPPVSAYPGHHSLPLFELLLLVVSSSVREIGLELSSTFC